jgi:hypothetical protein
MRRRRAFLWIVPVLCLLGAASSAQTVLTDVWKDKEYRGRASKIAVFCIARDRTRRILLEDDFVRQLKARGTAGMPVYAVIPPDKMVDKETALAKIRGLGADTVITMRLIDKLTARTNISEPAKPGQAGLPPGPRFYEYVYDPITLPDGEPAYIETILFDAQTGQRVWAARSVTKLTVIDQKAMRKFTGGMLERLAADTMIR